MNGGWIRSRESVGKKKRRLRLKVRVLCENGRVLDIGGGAGGSVGCERIREIVQRLDRCGEH